MDAYRLLQPSSGSPTATATQQQQQQQHSALEWGGGSREGAGGAGYEYPGGVCGLQDPERQLQPQADPALNEDMCMRCGGADVEEVMGANLQLAYTSSSPVNALPPSTKGFHDTMGNSWEWAEDHFAAFPGFKVGGRSWAGLGGAGGRWMGGGWREDLFGPLLPLPK